MSATKPTIAVTKAHAEMLIEFAERQPAGCRRCRVPMPFWGIAPGNSGYWYQPAPPPCEQGCHTVLIELWARLTTEYTIAPRDPAPPFTGKTKR